MSQPIDPEHTGIEPIHKEPVNPGLALVVLVLVWFAALVLFGGFQNEVSNLFLGDDAGTKLFSDKVFLARHIWFARVMQSLYTVLVFLLPPLVMAQFFRLQPGEYFRTNHLPKPNHLVLGLMIVAASLPLIYFTTQLNQQLQLPASMKDIEKAMEDTEKSLAEVTTVLLTMTTIPALLANLVMFAFLPALGEELFFRGGMQRLLGKRFGNEHVAIFVSAIIFSAIHFQFYGFLPRVLLGVTFGYLYFFSRNLWVPIIAHMIYNGYQVVLVYFMPLEELEKIETSTELSPWLIVGAFALFVGLLYSFYKIRTTEPEISEDATRLD